MRVFLALIKLSFQRQLAYRSAALAGLATNFFFGLLRASVLLALYGQREVVEGMSVQDIITYTGLTQAMIAYLSIFSWFDLMDTVRSGDIASDLLKPMNYFSFWLAQDLGRASANFLLRGVTMMVIYAIVFDLTYPQSVVQWLALAIALILSLLVSFSYRFLVNLAAFWTPEARGVGRFAFGIVYVMSGMMLPLRFFPDWFITIANLTPFPSMINTVVEIYLGLLSGPEIVQALSIQVFWLAALMLLGQVVFRAGLRKLVIQGG